MSFPLLFPFALSFVFPTFSSVLSSPFDCSFEPSPSNVEGFCAWRPDNEQSVLLWHNGDAVLVDAANSLVHSADGETRFAYAQGHFGSPTEGSLRSPHIVDRLEFPGELTLSYWKVSASPSLDICVEEDAYEPLRCVDTIQGPGQPQWVRRAVELPKAEKPFRVVLRARNLLSAEDFVGVDDIRLRSPAPHQRHPQAVDNGIGISDGDTAPKNPFDGIDAEEELEQGQNQQQRKGETHLAQQKMLMVVKQPNQQHSPIRPQIRLSPSLTQPMRPFSGPSKANDQSHDPPIPPNDDLSSSFSSDLSKLATGEAQKSGEEAHCRAVSCSFMEGNCLWQLDPGWHNNSEGSLSIQSPVQFSKMISAMFNPALTSSLDFDLWMSDNTEISVTEKHIGKENKGMDILLFSRHGATDGGWHRFRVPLRPSFSPVRLIFRIKIGEEVRQTPSVSNSVSIANVKLVNGDGNEIGCETFEEPHEANMPKTGPMPSSVSLSTPNFPSAADNLFGMNQPTPLQLPSQFPMPPPLLVVPSPSFPPSPFAPPPPPPPPVGPPSAPFNPFSPMFEGILPIVPLRVNPPRLTALMDAPVQRQQLLMSPPLTTKEKALLAEKEQSVTQAEHQLQGLLPIGTDGSGGVPSMSDESVDDAEERRHQLKRVIRPESHVREVPKNAQLVILPRGRKLGRRGQTKGEQRERGREAPAGWPMVDMGATDHAGGEKGKDEKNDEFRRRL